MKRFGEAIAHCASGKRVPLMTRNLILVVLIGTGLASGNRLPETDRAQQRLEREVRHEILTQPFLDVFDNIEFRVDGYSVKLTGFVTRPVLKSGIEKAVKDIEGVEAVDNQIEVLPLSPHDDRLRFALYRSIYGYPALRRYAMPVIKPIRIIVKNGNVILEGVVDTEADKNLVGIRANVVAGAFSLTNNLHIEK